MLNALYIGLGGMNAYSRSLTTVSANVTNLNTPGYKAAHPTFADTYHASGQGFYSAGTQGGGVQLGATSTDYTQGELRASAGELDIGVDGPGFLVLLKGADTLYARTGQFTLDDDGFIVLSGTTNRLATLDSAGHLVGYNLDARRTDPPVATRKVTFSDNLSSTATTASVPSITVFDASGAKRVWQVTLTPDTTIPGQWQVKVVNDQGADVGSGAINFINGVIDPTRASVAITDATTPASPLTVTLDFSRASSFSTGTTSSLRASEVDGSASGELATIKVNADGQIELAYSNGRTEKLSAIALADIRAPQQLQAQGGGLFAADPGAKVHLVASHAGRAGKAQGKVIEASNVNLSQEFGDLILLQRGFQASSQVVSVTNEMIQQLFGIRGNG